MPLPVESSEDSFRVGAPRPLFKMPGTSLDEDVAADGLRFLISQPVAGTGQPPLLLIARWPKLLQR